MPLIKKTGNNVTKTFTDSENTTPNINGIISGETALEKVTFEDSTGSEDIFIQNNNGTLIIPKMNIPNTTTPSGVNDIGTKGDIVWDTNYLYICTANNVWTRIALSW